VEEVLARSIYRARASVFVFENMTVECLILVTNKAGRKSSVIDRFLLVISDHELTKNLQTNNIFFTM